MRLSTTKKRAENAGIFFVRLDIARRIACQGYLRGLCNE